MDQYKLEMKEEDVDVYQEQKQSDTEQQDPSLTEQDRSTIGIKEEQDPSLTEQDRSIIGIKEEQQDQSLTEQDRSISEAEEEQQDRDHAGPTDQQLDDECDSRSPGNWTGGSFDRMVSKDAKSFLLLRRDKINISFDFIEGADRFFKALKGAFQIQ